MPATTPGSGVRRRPIEIGQRAALGVLACALTALVDQSALDLPFVFDDRTTVLMNPSLVDIADLRGLIGHDLPRVAVNLSYAFDRAFWGFSSFGFHVTNFVLHVLVVGLLYGWGTRALSDARSGQETATVQVEWPAFFAAAAFALHPVMGATAAYVSARSELLGLLGVLAAMTFARRAIVASSSTAAAAALAFAALALGSSASAAALPVLILTYDAWVLRDPGWRRRFWRVYLPGMVLVALAAAWHLAAVLSAPRVPPRGLAANLMTQSLVVSRYLWLLVSLTGQAIVHQVHWITSPLEPAGLIVFALLAGAAAAAIGARRAQPLVAFGLVWFLATLAPTSSIFPLRDAMAEQRLYVPAAGFFLALASALAGPLATRRLARLIAAGVLVLLAVRTGQRNRVWSDPLVLWQEAIVKAPDAWQARLGYADLLQEIGRCGEARPEYQAVLRLYPDQPDAVKGLEQCR